MGLFRKTPQRASQDAISLPGFQDPIKSPLPVQHLDISKRYDIYVRVFSEYRLYENVTLIAIKTMDDIREFGYSTHSFLEIESPGRTRTMIPAFHIESICEHGAEQTYIVLKNSRADS